MQPIFFRSVFWDQALNFSNMILKEIDISENP